MTLFDALEGKRLSEVFSFDLNPAELKSEFVSDLQDQNSSEKGKTVVDQVESIIKSTGVDESWLLMPSRKVTNFEF